LCVGAFVAADINRNKSPNTQRIKNKTTDVVIHQQSLQVPEDGYINVRNMLSA